MVVTLVMGNGFDVGLNMATRYIDFYPFYEKQAKKNSLILKAISDDKKNNYERWSDLEIALGKFCNSITKDQINKFIDDKIEMDDLLKEYLLLEEQKYIPDEKSCTEIIKSAIQKMKKSGIEKETQKINEILQQYASNPYVYKVTSFNYTDSVDRIWGLLKGKEVGGHMYHSSRIQETLGEILHVHGTLQNGEMIIGVNDESQIENKELLENLRFRRCMLKPFLNEQLGQNKTVKAKNMINESRIVCLYGMSIGDTDKIWWEHIGEWLRQADDRILLIYNYNPKYEIGHAVRRLEHIDTIKNSFLSKTLLDEVTQKRVLDRIIVHDNENIFEMR